MRWLRSCKLYLIRFVSVSSTELVLRGFSDACRGLRTDQTDRISCRSANLFGNDRWDHGKRIQVRQTVI